MRSVAITICSLVFVSVLQAQELDSLHVLTHVEMQQTIDSLREQLKELAAEVQKLKAGRSNNNELDSLLLVLNNGREDAIPEDQRSRRKRVDMLLKAITERPGQLRFNGGATTTIQGKPGEFAIGVGSFDIFAHTSFGPNTLLFIDFEAIGGNGPDEHIQTLASLNADAGSTQGSDGVDRLTVLEAWAEFTFLGEAFKITTGKIDLTNYFDNNAAANDETSQFISGAFVNSAAFPVPGNSPGVRVRTTLLNRFFLQAGLASVDNSGSDLFDNLFKIGSVGFKVFPESTWEANLRVYGYSHPAAGNALGVGVSFDEAIAEMFNVFARYNENESELAQWFGVSSAWSAGIRFTKTVLGRELAVGVAYGRILPHRIELKDESIAELYLRHQLNQWVYVSPHLQVVWNAGGSSDTRTVLGFRTHFNF